MFQTFIPNINDGLHVIVNNTTEYKGRVVEVLEEGFWLTEDYQTEEYIAYSDITHMEVLVYNTELL